MTPERRIEHLIDYQRRLMEQASEDHWAAGWMQGLEEMMWSGSMRDTEEAILCRELARETGAWIVWNRERGEAIGLDLRDWIARHGPAPDDPARDEPEDEIDPVLALADAARAWRDAWTDEDDSIEAIQRRIDTLGRMIATAEALPPPEEAAPSRADMEALRDA